jgi:hypothetical protein
MMLRRRRVTTPLFETNNDDGNPTSAIGLADKLSKQKSNKTPALPGTARNWIDGSWRVVLQQATRSNGDYTRTGPTQSAVNLRTDGQPLAIDDKRSV